jgi:glutamate dehydrogenase (NAD(P)+)
MRYTKRSTKVVAVSDITGGISNPAGLDIPALLRCKSETGGVANFPGGVQMARDEVLEMPCDVLVAAARENQVTADNADRFQCRMVAEGANGPTTPDADDILADRGIIVLPDILASAGGVTVSYFEWAQSRQKHVWDAEQIRSRLRAQMRGAVQRVFTSTGDSVDRRTAALAVAIDRVVEAAKLRGIYP